MKKLYIVLISITLSFSTFAQNPNWTLSNTNLLSSSINKHMIFVNNQHGYISDANQILETHDGGLNWTQKIIDSTIVYYGMFFKISDSILVLGNDSSNKLFEITFSASDTSNNYTKKASYFRSGSTSNYSFSYLTSFQGAIWHVRNDSLMKYFNDTVTLVKPGIKSFSINNGYISAANTDWFYYSNDTALTWDSSSFIIPPSTMSIMAGVGSIQTYYNGNDTIFAIGRSFPANDYVSYDKGMHWLSLTPSGGDRKPNIYHFYDASNIIGCFHGNVYTSTNNGLTFITDSVDLQMRNSSMYILNDSVAFLYGDNGNVYRTINAGGLIGIQEVIKEQVIQIYPNPSTDRITLKYEPSIQLTQIAIYNIEGKLIKSFPPNNQILDVSDIESGNYILKLDSKKERFSNKVIIQ